jgi:two-component sensor histidine kinase
MRPSVGLSRRNWCLRQEGSPIAIGPGLAVHELATNASKYGALSTDNGRVDVDWRAAGRSFAITWTERGGPPVQPPDRRGFGSTVVESMAKRAVGGEVCRRKRRQGQLEAPAAV